MVLLKRSDMMLRNSIVDLERLGDLVDIVGLPTQQVDDPRTIRSTSGPSQNIP